MRTLAAYSGPITLNVILLDASHCLVRSLQSCMRVLTALQPAHATSLSLCVAACTAKLLTGFP